MEQDAGIIATEEGEVNVNMLEWEEATDAEGQRRPLLSPGDGTSEPQSPFAHLPWYKRPSVRLLLQKGYL